MSIRGDIDIREEGLLEAVFLAVVLDLLFLGRKWATCNVGATAPEEYGDYFAWGETEPYYSSMDPLTWKDGKSAGYMWASYQWCNGSWDSITKYCTSDNKTVLDIEDDAAYANWGGNWRMPADEEWAELMEECTWVWTTQNGVNGQLVTGPNGNSIFLPAGASWFTTELDEEYLGTEGNYWSSSLDTVSPDRANMVTISYYSSSFKNQYSRFQGYSIRPVTE